MTSPLTEDVTRPVALALLWQWVALAAQDDARDALKAVHWVQARSEDDGGFLWLAGKLGCRPSVIEAKLKAVAASSPRERSRLRRRIAAMLVNGENEDSAAAE